MGPDLTRFAHVQAVVAGRPVSLGSRMTVEQYVESAYPDVKLTPEQLVELDEIVRVAAEARLGKGRGCDWVYPPPTPTH